jgi:hypothetical protein
LLSGCKNKLLKFQRKRQDKLSAPCSCFRISNWLPPELQALAENAWKSVQQGAFPEALKCLAQLEANPALNDAQKKSTVDLAEQVKKQVATTAAAK